MATYALPFGDSADSTYRLTLGEETYLFRFRWSTYDESWQCYIGGVGLDFSVRFKITSGFDLIAQYQHIDNVPKGQLYCLDVVKGFGRVDRDSVGNDDGDRFQLIFVEEE